MEENNTLENNEVNKEQKICGNTHRCWKECLAILAVAFLGGFLAVYFVADRVFDRPQSLFYPAYAADYGLMRDFDKIYERERKAFEREFRELEKNLNQDNEKHFANPKSKWFNKENNKNKSMVKIPEDDFNSFITPSMVSGGVRIETKLDDEKYKVTIGLNAFGGDENKINYNVSGRKLTVFGNSTVKEENFEQDISFSQDFVLPKNVDLSKISKKKDGDKLIIEVPLKK